MDQTEKLSRTVAEQQTGNEENWREFEPRVLDAMNLAATDPSIYPRDFLEDEPALTGSVA